MVCKHQLALCKLHNCTACEHQGDEELCPYAYNQSEAECAPTFRQMIDIYREGGSCTRHKRDVERLVLADIALVGLKETDRHTLMTRTKFKTLIQLLQSPLRKGGAMRDASVASHLAAFRSISSEWMEDKFNEKGLDLPTFSIPKFKAHRVPVQETSDRTIRKVEIQMEKWLASGSPSDRDAFVFCFFALYCGMRAGDICANKWDIIRHTTAGVIVSYTPHKTKESTGVTVSFHLDNKTFCKIEPLIGKQDEYIIPRYENRIPKGKKSGGEFSGLHNYLRRKVNKALSAVGIGNDYRGQKKAHALRKYFETDRIMQVGAMQAAAESGHTLGVQKKYYAGSLLGKVA